jgi:hypothetical protein
MLQKGGTKNFRHRPASLEPARIAGGSRRGILFVSAQSGGRNENDDRACRGFWGQGVLFLFPQVLAGEEAQMSDVLSYEDNLSDVLSYEDNKERFVDRQGEIALVLDKIRALLRREMVHQRTVAFYGPRGSGKTWLVEEIVRQLVEDEEFRSWVIVLPVAVRVPLVGTPLKGVEKILRMALQQVSMARGGDSIASEAVAGPGELSAWLVREAKILWEAKHPLVVVVDGIDEAHPDLLRKLEDYLLGPLVKEPGTLVVLGGRTRDPRPTGGYTWMLPELKLYSEEWILDPFNEEWTRKQLERLEDLYPGAAPAASEIRKEGGGYPLSNFILAGGLAGAPPVWRDKAAAFTRCASELLVDVDKEWWPYFEALCVLNAFDEDRMPPLLDAHPRCVGSDWSFGKCLPIRERMVRTRLAHWQAEAGGYVMDRAVRIVLQIALQENGIELWRRLHQTARDLYVEWAERYPQSAHRWQPEAEYHAQYC